MKVFNKHLSKTIFIALTALVALSFLIRHAFASFEGQYVYGLGAANASTASFAAGSRYNVLEYFANPALINLVSNKRYVFSIGDYKPPEWAEKGLKYYLISQSERGKAYSFVSGDELGYKRDMVTYTVGKRSKKYIAGVNISAFRYSTPPFEFEDESRVPIPSDDGSGFTVDLGAYTEYSNKLKVGASLQNFITNISKTNDPYNRSVTLPSILSIGASYPLRDWLDVMVGIKSINAQSPDDLNSHREQMIYLGAEYHSRDKKISARAGFQSESTFTYPNSDRATNIGMGYRTDRYDLSFATYNLLTSFDSPSVITVGYQPASGKWREEYTEQEKPKPAAATEPATPKGPVFEQPLPTTQSEPKENEKNDRPEKQTSPTESSAAAPAKSTLIADFRIDPKIILLPIRNGAQFTDIDKHWANTYVAALSKEGYFPKSGKHAFQPNGIAERAEFYRLVFLTQLTRLFSSPITMYFKTPYGVSARAELSSPKLEQPVTIIEGTYEKTGLKRLVINAKMLEEALQNSLGEDEIFAGKYKLRMSVVHQDMLPKTLEDYITILDTSMDFSAVSNSRPEEKKKQIDTIKNNLNAIGIDLDYLDGLLKESGLSRLEALRDLFRIAKVKTPKDFDRTNLFTDVRTLPDDDQATIFVASRGMASLNGKPLMAGYPDRTFKPSKEMTYAETAALIDRFRMLAPSDFEPPYNAPVIPEPLAPVAKPQQLQPSSLISNLPAPQRPIPPQGLISHVSKLPSSSKTGPSYFLVSGSFLDKLNALKEISRLRELKFNPFIVIENMDGMNLFHTAVSAHSSREQARLAELNINPDYFQPRIITMNTGGAFSTPTTSPVPLPKSSRKDTQGPSRSHAEIEMKLKGESFLPWNLIQDINTYNPDTPDSIKQPDGSSGKRIFY